MWYCIHIGLDENSVVFYAANIALALAHMHARKIAFRNLKPENCLIDSDGFIRIVGFGFAKSIPYYMLGSVHYKTYTLCGTPGKLIGSVFVRNDVILLLFLYRIFSSGIGTKHGS